MVFVLIPEFFGALLNFALEASASPARVLVLPPATESFNSPVKGG